MTTQEQRMGAYYASAVRAEPKPKPATKSDDVPPRFRSKMAKAAKKAKTAKAAKAPKPPKVPKPTPQALKRLLPESAQKGWHKIGVGAKMANGFRHYREVTREQMRAVLYGYSPAFKLMKRVLAYQYTFVQWGRTEYPKTFDDMPAAARMNLVPKWAMARQADYVTAVGVLATEIADIATAEKVNALDIVDEIYDAAFVGKSEAYINSGIRAVGFGSSGVAQRVAKKLNLVKRLRPRLVRSNMPLLNKIGNELGKLDAFAGVGAVPYTAIYGAKPWKTGKSQNVMGVEVTGFAYKIATAVDDTGKPTAETRMEHALASEKAFAKSGNDAGKYKAILGRTPLGRVFLCQDPATKNLFLASDHSPRSKVWVQNEDSKFLKWLYNSSGNLSMFVF
jgi:hypothetical protein